ncbi:hypothetical protein HZB01_05670 [Candidatus Woesearchaeota archaeon]|nr:hypothetical protein [Candidatus Woesearchaeota archaeon]
MLNSFFRLFFPFWKRKEPLKITVEDSRFTLHPTNPDIGRIVHVQYYTEKIVSLFKKAEGRLLQREELNKLQVNFSHLSKTLSQAFLLEKTEDQNYSAVYALLNELYTLIYMVHWQLTNNAVFSGSTTQEINAIFKRLRTILGIEEHHQLAMVKKFRELETMAKHIQHADPLVKIPTEATRAHHHSYGFMASFFLHYDEGGARTVARTMPHTATARKQMMQQRINQAMIEIDAIIKELTGAAQKLNKAITIIMNGMLEVAYELNRVALAIVSYEQSVEKQLHLLRGDLPKSLKSYLEQISTFGNSMYYGFFHDIIKDHDTMQHLMNRTEQMTASARRVAA